MLIVWLWFCGCGFAVVGCFWYCLSWWVGLWLIVLVRVFFILGLCCGWVWLIWLLLWLLCGLYWLLYLVVVVFRGCLD